MDFKPILQGKHPLGQIFKDLNRCTAHDQLCRGIFERISERSPTALALTTCACLRHNEGRPLKEVFRMDGRSRPIHDPSPGLLRGSAGRALLIRTIIRAWNPGTIDDVDSFQMDGLFLTNEPAKADPRGAVPHGKVRVQL